MAAAKAKAEGTSAELAEMEAKWKDEKVRIKANCADLWWSIDFLKKISIIFHHFTSRLTQEKSASLMGDLRRKIESLDATVETMKQEAKAMDVELVKLRFDKETLEEDAEERVVSAPQDPYFTLLFSSYP